MVLAGTCRDAGRRESGACACFSGHWDMGPTGATSIAGSLDAVRVAQMRGSTSLCGVSFSHLADVTLVNF